MPHTTPLLPTPGIAHLAITVLTHCTPLFTSPEDTYPPTSQLHYCGTGHGTASHSLGHTSLFGSWIPDLPPHLTAWQLLRTERYPARGPTPLRRCTCLPCWFLPRLPPGRLPPHTCLVPGAATFTGRWRSPPAHTGGPAPPVPDTTASATLPDNYGPTPPTTHPPLHLPQARPFTARPYTRASIPLPSIRLLLYIRYYTPTFHTA